MTAATLVEDGFDARRDAPRAPTSTGSTPASASSPFERGRALWWPHRIDREALDACAAALPGSHDFTAFTPTQTDHVHFERNVLAADWTAEGDILVFRVTADAFMRNMVRVLVGTMLEVACGRRTRRELHEHLLNGRPPLRRPATQPHPTACTWSRSPTHSKNRAR